MKDEIFLTHDLRHMLPEVRDQGPRPLCLAFAASDLNSASNGVSHALSVEYLAYHTYLREGHANYDIGLTTQGIIGALKDVGQPGEDILPYDPNATIPKKPTSQSSELFCSPTREATGPFTSIEKQMERGAAPVACISLPLSFGAISAPYRLDREDGHIGNHAVLIVGSGKTASGAKYYLIRNSWGIAWGDNGHCWLSKQFLIDRMFALIEVIHPNESN